MDRLPFGVARLDALLGGGPPKGSVVLLAGEPGAGAREFLATCALMNALGNEDPEAFERHYGGPPAGRPETVEYVSLTDDPAALRAEFETAFDREFVERATEGVEFGDLSSSYFGLSPVPREWYAHATPDIEALGDRGDRHGVFETLATHLSERAHGSLVCLDSVTDLLAADADRSASDVATVLKGVRRAASDWGGLVVLLLDRSTVSATERGMLENAVDATLTFRWERGGSELARTMELTKFRGVLPTLDPEDLLTFETEFRDAGFAVSDVRKIR
ncbi:MAG: HTR-like protein [Halalkalicoccus sp.]